MLRFTEAAGPICIALVWLGQGLKPALGGLHTFTLNTGPFFYHYISHHEWKHCFTNVENTKSTECMHKIRKCEPANLLKRKAIELVSVSLAEKARAKVQKWDALFKVWLPRQKVTSRLEKQREAKVTCCWKPRLPGRRIKQTTDITNSIMCNCLNTDVNIKDFYPSIHSSSEYNNQFQSNLPQPFSSQSIDLMWWKPLHDE